ncbi:MAG: RNA polymerase sigma factor [Dehalococcoidia bacterium]|nr:RNA polymerase sigma factor [Dehalococcoidia bacterium]
MTGQETTTFAVQPRRDENIDTDDALVKAAATEPAAFGLLYGRYYDRVYRYCRARTQTHEDSADLAQQVFVQAFHNLHRYRPRGSSFAAWLFRIAHNLAIDANRRRRHQTVPWDDVPEMTAPVAREIGPEDAAVRNDELARLRVEISKLPPDQRDVLVLRFASGLSVREIAAVIGKSESATQMRLWRGLQTIRKGR